MTMVTKSDIEKGYEKMQNLPQEKLILLLGIIDQFSNPSPSESSVTLGIADGKYSYSSSYNSHSPGLLL